jgi:hypothetical protein
MAAKSIFLICVPENSLISAHASNYPLDATGPGYAIVMLGDSFATDTQRRTVIAPLAQHRSDFG